MTAKEKAKELVDKYNADYLLPGATDAWITKEASKKFALMAVDAVIIYLQDWTGVGFWHDVKEEIETL